jgi:hypothetical protein
MLPRAGYPLLWLVLPLCACSSAATSKVSSSTQTNVTVFGVCPAGSLPEASLGMTTKGAYGYTMPVVAGQTSDVTLTVINRGDVEATQMVDLTPHTPALSFKGGTYPGTGGTCADTLKPGTTCDLVVTLVAPASGRQTSLVIIQYYNGLVYATDTHQIEAVATPMPFATASHAPLPPMPQHGGPVYHHVNLVTATYSDTPNDADIQKFGDWIVTSSYWASVGKDYGVLAGTHTHVKLPIATPATLSDSDISTYVDTAVKAGTLPAATSETVYALFLSSAAQADNVPNAVGWHNQSPGGHTYAVVLPGCSSAPADVLNTYTFVAAHELSEAATDPQPNTGYSFGFGQGEVGDVCNVLSTQDGYAVPTVWSNSAAAAGADPCVPGTGLPYVDVDPVPASVGLSAKAGATVSVTLTGWTTAPVGDWLVQASVVGGGGIKAALDPMATDLVNNGETLKLTLTSDGSAKAGSTALVEVVSVAPGLEGALQGVQFIPVNVSP